MDEAQNKGDKPNREVRAAIFGSVKDNQLFKWTGDHKPNQAWLAKPLENISGDKIAKQSCTGCGMEGEVSMAHLERIFGVIKTSLDCHKIDWQVNFLEVNACDFCVENVPDRLMITFALGKLPK